MPLNVILANPVAVLPITLSRAYQRVRKYEMLSTFYQDGSNQRNSLVVGDRSAWMLSKRLASADMFSLRSFYTNTQGSLFPFWFYDPYDANFQYDLTGASSYGRYTVRFQGPLTVNGSMGRTETQLSLVEIF